MTKAALIISAFLLFAGVAAASSLTSLGAKSAPRFETPTLSTPRSSNPQPTGTSQTRSEPERSGVQETPAAGAEEADDRSDSDGEGRDD